MVIIIVKIFTKEMILQLKLEGKSSLVEGGEKEQSYVFFPCRGTSMWKSLLETQNWKKASEPKRQSEEMSNVRRG